VSGQLGHDRGERISGVRADDDIGEAALLPQPLWWCWPTAAWSPLDRLIAMTGGRLDASGIRAVGDGLAITRR
jgi:hypothetical protein